MKQKEIKELQLERLKEVVLDAYNGIEPFRKALDGISFKPDSIRSLDDIRSLPFTTKNDFKENYTHGYFCSRSEEIVRLQTSNSDSEKPLVTAYTKEDIAMWTDAVKRCLLCAGINNTDVVFNAYPNGGLGVQYGIEALGATVIPASGINTKSQINIIKELGVTAICATPSYFNFIVEQASEMNIDLHDLPLKTGIFGSELWTEEMRLRIEGSSGIKAYDIYGLPEIISPGVGVECEFRNGLHILEDLFYVEIIDPETGKNLPDGELGELVLTTLCKQAMPLIRYRTGDISRILEDSCKCGCSLRRIERISTRSQDMIVVQGVNIFPSQIEAALLSVEGTLPYYNIVLNSENGIDGIEVNVEITEAVFSDKVRSLEAFQHKLVDAIESVLGLRIKLKLVAPGAIQRSGGMAKRVVDHRGR